MSRSRRSEGADLQALGKSHTSALAAFDLLQSRHDLFRRKTLPLHRELPSSEIRRKLTSDVDQFHGGASV